jgi:hypothetical protein
VFVLGAGSSALVAVLAAARPRLLQGGFEAQPAPTAKAIGGIAGPDHANTVPAWVVLAMALVDRATGGVLTGTLSLFLAGFFAYDAGERGWMVGVLAVLGLAGSALLPTSLALEHAVDRGPVGFTAFATSGGVGYASGAVIPVMVLGVAGEAASSYQGIIVGFALLHAAVTCCAVATARPRG